MFCRVVETYGISPRCPLRAGARRGRDPQPGGAAGDRHQLGRPARAWLPAPTAVVGAERRASRSSSPAARAARAGATFSCSCASAGSQGSSSWSPTITRGSGRRSLRCCPKPPSSAATCTSSGTCWTMCRARSTMTVCASSGGSTTGATSPRHGVMWGLVRQMADDLPQAVRLGGRAHRGNAHLLSAAAPASQAPQVDG
jgi:hypothetical protein